MTERERLIELLKESLVRHIDKTCKLADNLANDLLANGVIVPPCKVGDTVYKVIADNRVKRPHECKVIGFWYSEDESCNAVHLVRYVNGAFGYSTSIPFSEFGKTVFLTKEEAEKALERSRVNGLNNKD